MKSLMKMGLLPAFGAVAAFGLAAGSVEASEVTIIADPEHGGMFGNPGADSGTPWREDRDDSEIHVGWNNSWAFNHVFMFELPELSPGEWVDDATVSFWLKDKSTGGNARIEIGADLYGTGFRPDSPIVEDDFFGGGPSDPNAFLIEQSVITTETPDDTWIDVSNQTLVDYLQGTYDAGAQGGDFVFFRLNSDTLQETSDDVKWYNFQVWYDDYDNPNANVPELTMSIVPEPTSLALLGAGGALMLMRRRSAGRV